MAFREEDQEEFSPERIRDTSFQRTQTHKQGVKEEKLQQQQKENQSSDAGTKK